MGAKGRTTALGCYLGACTVMGLPTLAVTATVTRFGTVTSHYVTVAALVLTLVVGEMRPIPVARGDEAGDEISISTTVALAMTYLLPLGVPMVAQAAALTADEVRARRDWVRLVFNISQYSLALLASRAAFAGLTGDSVFGGRPWAFTTDAMRPALLSSVVFFLVNNALTDVAVALKLRRPVARHTFADIRAQVPPPAYCSASLPCSPRRCSGRCGRCR